MTKMSPQLESVFGNFPMQGLDFGYCGVDQETTKTLTLTNPTSSQVRFTVQAAENNFTVNTSSGK